MEDQLDCVRRGVSDVCGEEAAAWLYEMERLILTPTMEEMQCFRSEFWGRGGQVRVTADRRDEFLRWSVVKGGSLLDSHSVQNENNTVLCSAAVWLFHPRACDIFCVLDGHTWIESENIQPTQYITPFSLKRSKQEANNLYQIPDFFQCCLWAFRSFTGNLSPLRSFTSTMKSNAESQKARCPLWKAAWHCLGAEGT